MELWNNWMVLVKQLKPSCSRQRTFFWLVVVLIGFSTKFDCFGVTSLARGIGLQASYYTCLLHLFSSTAVDLKKLKHLWVHLILTQLNIIERINGRGILVCDGIKIAKEGKKMTGVKLLHQESESNSKAEYIMGHSLQAICLLVKGVAGYFALPLTGEVHEGYRFNCRDKRTLLDKMSEMTIGLKLNASFYLVADKYYGSGRFMKQLLSNGHHLVTMMKKRAVAYRHPEPKKTGRGRPKTYGERVKIFELFKTELPFVRVPMPGDNKTIIEYCSMQLLWKPFGKLAQFVLVRHPVKGLSVCMTSDLTLDPLSIIKIYKLRFKIEVTFKQAVHQIGTFMYRFWLKAMAPTKRGAGNWELQFAPSHFKKKVARKIHAYHLFIQLGFIAQGLIQCLAINYPQLVWKHFKSWLRTIRPGLPPSEKVVSMTLASTYDEFLRDEVKSVIFKKFIRRRSGLNQGSYKNSSKKEAA